jgi:putative transposase
MGTDKLKDLFKETLQQIFEAEMEEHLGYAKHDPAGNNSGNSRNGYSQTSNQLEDQIIAMYAKGLSTRDIEKHMQDIYGIDVSPTMVSKITDKILPMIAEWQSRPLDRIYLIVFLDAIHFKVRQDSRIVNKAAYSVLGINLEGHKEILGIWVGEHESAKFWLNVLNELKNRGVEDILIACRDGLSGFSEAINAVFPQTELQLC